MMIWSRVAFLRASVCLEKGEVPVVGALWLVFKGCVVTGIAFWTPTGAERGTWRMESSGCDAGGVGLGSVDIAIKDGREYRLRSTRDSLLCGFGGGRMIGREVVGCVMGLEGTVGIEAGNGTLTLES